MSSVIYKTLDDLVNSVVESYCETREIGVILDVEIAADFLNQIFNYNSNGFKFKLDSMCACKMFEDQLHAQMMDEPFMITILKDGEIITERFHSDYEIGAYADIWYFIDEKYSDRINKFKPSHYSLFNTEFDSTGIM